MIDGVGIIVMLVLAQRGYDIPALSLGTIIQVLVVDRFKKKRKR